MKHTIHNVLKRVFDISIALVSLILLSLPILVIALSVRVTSRGPVFYYSNRVGRENRIFKMPKFRTMKQDAPIVATHLLKNPDDYLTPIGSFLRRSSLDELPQLGSILIGHMSFVGPRPALFNQFDLIALRTQYGVDVLKPGLTGWAQINGRDELTIEEKVNFDREYLRRQSLSFDMYIFFMTIHKTCRRESISH